IGTDCTFKRFRCRPFSSSSINIKAFALGFSVSFVSSVVKGFCSFSRCVNQRRNPASAKLVIHQMKPVIAKFLTSAADPRVFPPEGPPEFAFLGRSNVGKSSLINSLLGQKMAHVSSTPGRTRTINFIGIYGKPGQPHPALILVDLPGYGYAKIPRAIA